MTPAAKRRRRRRGARPPRRTWPRSSAPSIALPWPSCLLWWTGLRTLLAGPPSASPLPALLHAFLLTCTSWCAMMSGGLPVQELEEVKKGMRVRCGAGLLLPRLPPT